MPGTPIAAELQVVGMGKEAQWGTAVVADYYLSAKGPTYEDVIDYIKDQGMRGSMAATHAVFPGPGYGQFKTGEFPVYVDSIGRVLGAVVGPDTLTGAGPYVHTFKLAADQPDSLTVLYNDGYEVRTLAGARPTSLSFKWAQGAELTAELELDSQIGSIAGSVTPAFGSAGLALQGWMATAEVNGTANLTLVGFQLDLKRKSYIQHGSNNQQGPTNMIVKALEVSGKATFDITDDSILTAFEQNIQPTFAITLSGGANVQMVFTMTKCSFLKAPISGKDVMQVDVDFEAVENSTDAGNIQVAVTNSVTTAY